MEGDTTQLGRSAPGESVSEILLPEHGGLTLAACKVPTKATPSLPSSAGQGGGI